VPPELDALCVAATRPLAADRVGSARSLGDQLTRYLDGDRDVALRRKVALEHLAAARAALAGGDGESERRAAMREAGRALALDPTVTDAADLAGRLMLEPPSVTPREVDDEIAQLEDSEVKAQSAAAVLGFVVYLLFLPVIAWNGVRDGWDIVAIGTAMGLNGLLALLIARAPGRISQSWIYVAALGNCLLLALLSRLLGPFLVVPGLAAATTMAFSFYPWMKMWILWLAISAAVLAPLGLEMLGVLPRTVSVEGGDLVLSAPALELRVPQIEITLVAYVVALVGISALLARRLAGAQRETRRALHLQAWHLRQLMPSRRPATLR
jgi:serine/threonine-protein kinase